MMNFNVRCKSIALGAMIALSHSFVLIGSETVPAGKTKKTLAFVGRFIPGSKAAKMFSVVAVLATWIRLNTKGSSFDYKLKDWRSDFELFLKSLNICDAESRAVLLMLFDKWIVGRQLSIIDVSYETTDDNGMITTLKDKKIKAKPFGLMGWIDALVLKNIEKINDYAKEMNSVRALINDPVKVLTKD